MKVGLVLSCYICDPDQAVLVPYVILHCFTIMFFLLHNICITHVTVVHLSSLVHRNILLLNVGVPSGPKQTCRNFSGVISITCIKNGKMMAAGES